MAIEKNPDQKTPSVAQGLNGQAIAILGSIFFFFAVQSGVWTYIERIGSGAGISAAVIGTALATGAFVGLIGALTAAGIAAKFGRVLPLTFTTVFQAISILLLLDNPAIAAFFAASALFQFFWNFGIPFQMGVMSRADPTGRYVVLITAVTGAGFTAGPLIAAAVLERIGISAFVGVEVLLCALSLTFILPIALRQSSGKLSHA